ncbi:MAG: amidophosphoribosyltransferase [bacterium]|nr:amidophosphoribosyltransferase [bacterium]
MREECGVFGAFNCDDAGKLCYLGLYALQHRGQESAGIVSFDGKNMYVVKDMGLVSDIYNSEKLSYLKGNTAIGHVRYSTTGSSNINNIQPLYSRTSKGKIAIAHNGNLTNAYDLYKTLISEGALFQSTVDSEVILHMVSRSRKLSVIDAMKETLANIQGAYSLVVLGKEYLMAARDPHGFRPLVLGKLGDGFIVCSETCALDLIGAEYIRDIEPGEILFIDKTAGLKSYQNTVKTKPSFCVFEHVYFSRPDSLVFGESVHNVRKEFGKRLAREYPVDADIVMSIPDSGNSAALGYAEESEIPFEFGMTRNHYVGRTFIQPSQQIRDLGVKIKLNPIKSVLDGKRVVVVDDSIVRGTTCKRRVQAIRKAGAREVHLRISSPPVNYPCHFGIDTPKREQLIAASKSIDEIREFVGADTLGYLSIDGMLESVSCKASLYCAACFNGKYPVKVKNKGKYSFESRKIKLYAQKNGH